MNERWLPCIGFSLYEVSDRGRVRRATAGRGATVGRVLRPARTRDGYLYVSLRGGRRGSGRSVKVHTLVLTAFVGPRPGSEHEANHRNGDRSDNRRENLEWLTHADNVRDSYAKGRHDQAGERNGRAKLTRSQVAEIRISAGTQREIAERYGVSRSLVGQIRQGVVWPDVETLLRRGSQHEVAGSEAA